jgi:hypothetical protein
MVLVNSGFFTGKRISPKNIRPLKNIRQPCFMPKKKCIVLKGGQFISLPGVPN